MTEEKRIYTAIDTLVLLMMVFPIGIAVFVLGFGLGDSPCIMCWSERINLIAIALTGVFMMRYGLKQKYIGWLMVICLFGMFNTMRHIGLYSSQDNGQGFSLMLFGARTYTWSLVMHTLGLVVAIVLYYLENKVEKFNNINIASQVWQVLEAKVKCEKKN